MPNLEVKRKLAAILSADVEGYSRMMSEDEIGTIRTLSAYRRVISRLVHQYRGRVVDTPGDNLLAEFVSVVDAVTCAVEIQRELAERNQEFQEDKRMQFRIGVNLGDVVEEEERIYGDGVNIAARMESMCEGGGICISGTAFEHVENKLDLEFEDLGEQILKNVADPVHIHRVISDRETFGSSAPRSQVQSESDKPSIAVLPFKNLSGETDQEYFADGVSEDIISALSRNRWLMVIARNSSFVFKGEAGDLKEVGKQLGVRYVLDGSVRKGGDRIRIASQLIDASSGNQIWAERYTVVMIGAFDMPSSIGLTVTWSSSMS